MAGTADSSGDYIETERLEGSDAIYELMTNLW
jgi:hypothetical protein